MDIGRGLSSSQNTQIIWRRIYEWHLNEPADGALAAGADYPFTHDPHFEVLKQLEFFGVSVLTLWEFLGCFEYSCFNYTVVILSVKLFLHSCLIHSAK